MEVVSSYAVEMIQFNHIADDTVSVYRDATSYLVGVYTNEWEHLSPIEKPLQRFKHAERFVHSTKANLAPYDFDLRFPKMPCYLRRAAINRALGIVSSYSGNHRNWERNGCKGREPKLPKAFPLDMPCFYNDNMYREGEGDIVYLKLYVKNDWRFVAVRCKHTDCQYLRRRWSHVKASAPVLEKRHGKYFLRFSFAENVTMSDTPFEDRILCSVDLGLNSDAVCTAMRMDGTILARKFIDFSSDKDHLYHVLNRMKGFQQRQGSHDIASRWAYANHLNEELSRKIASAIDDFATLWSADVIVFEYLDIKRRAKRAWRQKLHLWRKRCIQELVMHKAHRHGVRVSRVCAWGTSALAYDGSGKLVRDENNHALATFPNGKRYNCDLSASYNIGARYILRELIKSLDANTRSQLAAKVPAAERRTSCVYADVLKAVSALRDAA